MNTCQKYNVGRTSKIVILCFCGDDGGRQVRRYLDGSAKRQTDAPTAHSMDAYITFLDSERLGRGAGAWHFDVVDGHHDSSDRRKSTIQNFLVRKGIIYLSEI